MQSELGVPSQAQPLAKFVRDIKTYLAFLGKSQKSFDITNKISHEYATDTLITQSHPSPHHKMQLSQNN